MSAFSAYGKYYDLLNDAKDYAAETDYVLGLIAEHGPAAEELLELGCGTGGHAFELAARGCSVQGIDLSPDMIARALARRGELPIEMAGKLQFSAADLRHFRAGRYFDAVISLFHVISYQPSNADLRQAIETARVHLQGGGLFVFDCWYGPAVLTDPPYIRSRDFRNAEFSAVRTATPTLDVNRNLVKVDYEFVVQDASGHLTDRFSEEHWLRYLFLPELELLLEAGGFRLSRACKWMTDESCDMGSWYVVIVATAC